MVLDPIPQSLPVHFFGSRPQPPTSPPGRAYEYTYMNRYVCITLDSLQCSERNADGVMMKTQGLIIHGVIHVSIDIYRHTVIQISIHILEYTHNDKNTGAHHLWRNSVSSSKSSTTSPCRPTKYEHAQVLTLTIPAAHERCAPHALAPPHKKMSRRRGYSTSCSTFTHRRVK